MALIRRDRHGLYVRVNGYICRPQVNRFHRRLEPEAVSRYQVGDKVAADHPVLDTAYIGGEVWFVHGVYRRRDRAGNWIFTPSEACFSGNDPVLRQPVLRKPVLRKVANAAAQLTAIKKLKNIARAEIEDDRLIIYTEALPILWTLRDRQYVCSPAVTKISINLTEIYNVEEDFHSHVWAREYPLWYFKEPGEAAEWEPVGCDVLEQRIRHPYSLQSGRLCLGRDLMQECRKALRKGDLVVVAMAVMLLVNRPLEGY